jgi:CYTH domain-containing protein
MSVDASTNLTWDPTQFGFAKMKYAAVERERRWLCDGLPDIAHEATEVYVLKDLYITDTQLRLRDASRPDGTSVWPRLARKVDMDASHRLITSIYLSPTELELFRKMPGDLLLKTRHVVNIGGQRMAIDEFGETLKGLVLTEAEFEDDEAMTSFAAPDWALREVTHDPAFSGGRLAALPTDDAQAFVASLTHDN